MDTYAGFREADWTKHYVHSLRKPLSGVCVVNIFCRRV